MAGNAPEGGGPASLKDILGNVSIGQLVAFILVGQAIQPLLIPYVNELTHLVYDAVPNAQLSPADLASAVVRGFLTEPVAGQEARRSGINDTHFRTLIRLAGEAIAPQAAAEALRRKIIPEDAGNADGVGFKQAIAEGNLADKWAPVIQALSVMWPSPNDALDALLEGQIDEPTARELYARFGGDPEFFTMLYNTRGDAPTPTEAAVMANRGIIPWEGEGPGVTSFYQAFLEGPWRNKWAEPFRKMSQYLPPPRTVVAMIHEGSITDKDAAHLLAEQGLPKELVAAYIESAHSQKLQSTKELAQGTVTTLYRDRLIARDAAQKMLEALKYTADDADFILQIVDVQKTQQALSAAVNRIHTLYVGHKLSDQDVLGALSTMKLPPAEVSGLMQIWALERATNVRTLTEAQIVDAWDQEIIDQAEAMTELQHIGYSPRDAWVLLSIKNKQALPDAPPAAALPPGVGP